MSFVPSLISNIIFPPSSKYTQNSILLSSFFLLIEFFVNKIFPSCCQIHEFSREFTFSVNLFGYTLQYFLLVISFLPITPAANTRICFHLHTACARYTVGTKLISVDDNKWKNKDSFNTGEEAKPLFCSYDLLSSKEERALTLRNSPTGNSYPN